MSTPPVDVLQTATARARQLAQELPASCRPDFLRLTRTLLHGPRFQWLLAEAHSDLLRHRLLHALEQVLACAGWSSSRLPLDASIVDVPALEAALARHAKGCAVVHVLGKRDWFTPDRWDAFNVRRERLANNAQARLIFWLDAQAIEAAATGAPDLWAWRAGVYSFSDDSDVATVIVTSFPHPQSQQPILNLQPATQKRQRVQELRGWLAATPALPDEQLAGLADELGQLLYDLGDFDEALEHWQTFELPLHQRRKDARACAITQGQIADILQSRGQLDEALRIRLEEQLPVYERLGDVRSKAVTQGKIADILQSRGQLDETLHIRQQEELPVYEHLGDVRSKAITQGKIADILQSRGQLDAALGLLRQEVLPIFEHLDDMRSEAVTQGKIANILRSRGQLDEALALLRQEVLLIFERLGDMRAKAATQSKIADILQSRGNLDEALVLLRQAVLPTFERLGDMRSKAVTQGQIANILQSCNQLDEALALLQQAVLPTFERLSDVREKAFTQGQIADIMQSRGQLDEALRIRLEEQLPVYERLGCMRETAVVNTKIAQQQFQQGLRSQASQRFVQALTAFEAMGLPEAESVREMMRERGIEIPYVAPPSSTPATDASAQS